MVRRFCFAFAALFLFASFATMSAAAEIDCAGGISEFGPCAFQQCPKMPDRSHCASICATICTVVHVQNEEFQSPRTIGVMERPGLASTLEQRANRPDIPPPRFG